MYQQTSFSQIQPEEINEVNCKQLDDDITMSWVINKKQDEIVIELCGCVLVRCIWHGHIAKVIIKSFLFIQTDNYIAFGLSGSDSGVQMFGSDVTWTWMNNEGVHAEELDINAYSQVLYYSFSLDLSPPNLITFII